VAAGAQARYRRVFVLAIATVDMGRRPTLLSVDRLGRARGVYLCGVGGVWGGGFGVGGFVGISVSLQFL